ncbi:MAG: nucleotidyltransferase family protein [Salinisphaeraceae bacterium]|nr:nucleotidyltransferase family protein [Salinisphaeraceae bacterium]
MKVMILAAGRGKRMRPLTDKTPKPLLKVGGKALIEHHLERLKAAGFDDIVINLAHLGGQIEQALGNGQQYGLRIRYSREGEQGLETGGGIRHALPLLGPGPFMVVNGDVYTDFPFGQLSERGLAENDLAHLVMVPNPPQHLHGDFRLVSGRVMAEGEPRLTFSGIGLYRAELVAGIEEKAFALAPLLRDAMQVDRVSGELYNGDWRDIGTPERLAALDAELRA